MYVPPQVIGATTSGSSIGVAIAPNGTSYSAWVELGTTSYPINFVEINALYPAGGTDLFLDIGIGPNATSVVPIVQAMRFNNINCPGMEGPLYIPPNSTVWGRIIQQSSVSYSATVSLTGYWRNGTPNVPLWYVCGMTYGTSTGGPSLTAGSGAFGTPVQYSLPQVPLKRLWIFPSMGANSLDVYMALQASLGPSGSQQIIYQKTYTGSQYSWLKPAMIEIDIPPGTDLWLAIAGGNAISHVMAAIS